MSKPHLSGWCSPDCSSRSHATCQERLDKGWLKVCECPDHPKKESA